MPTDMVYLLNKGGAYAVAYARPICLVAGVPCRMIASQSSLTPVKPVNAPV